MKGFFIIFFAIFIDLLQFIITLSLSGAVSTVGGALQFIPFIGTILGTSVWISGIVLGLLFDVVLSLSMGGALLVVLASEDAFYPSYVVGGFFGEAMPLFSVLPLWTGLTVLSLMRKKSESGSTIATGILSTTTMLAGSGGVSSAVRAASVAQTVSQTRAANIQQQEQGVEEKTARAPQLQNIRRVDGIRATPKRA